MDKGEYTVQVQVRHTECSRLELLTDTPLQYVARITYSIAYVVIYYCSVRVHITPALSLDPTSEPLAAENGLWFIAIFCFISLSLQNFEF